MEKRNIIIVYLTALSVLATYSAILYFNYDSIKEIIPTHIDYKGNVDGYDAKNQLWIASGVNLLLLLLVGYVLKKPQKANFPFEINESNKKRVYYITRLILSTLGIVMTFFFSTMIYNALNYNLMDMIRINSYIIFPPLLVLCLLNLKLATK